MLQLFYQHIRVHNYHILSYVIRKIKIYIYIKKLEKFLKFDVTRFSCFAFDLNLVFIFTFAFESNCDYRRLRHMLL